MHYTITVLTVKTLKSLVLKYMLHDTGKPRSVCVTPLSFYSLTRIIWVR